MNMMKKFAAGAFAVLVLAGNAYAAKWKELIFTDDINMGMAELAQYCMMNNISVADVLWANSAESGDIKPGQSLYLPASHADMLAIWQHKGAWKPKDMISLSRPAAPKRAAKAEAKPAELPAVKYKEQPAPHELVKAEPSTLHEPVKAELSPSNIPPQTEQAVSQDARPEAEKPAEKSNDDIIAMLREEVRTDRRNLPPEIKPAPSSLTANIQAESKDQAEILKPITTEKTASAAKKKQASPAKVIASTAKPDKILAGKRKKSAKTEIPGLMDPIIIFSPNGDPSQGPMRLIISGDRVEVVQLPKSAVPKLPSISDLNNSFGTNPNYLPHYNMTPKKRDPFILNMGNLADKMLWPVDGKVSSPFGKWRGSHRHQGIDIPMPAGTPIRAARNGVVSKTGNNSTPGYRGYGNFVIMDHGDGLQTFYAHCLSTAVVPGQRVMQGQIIAYVGSTGRSTGNHLHFEVRVNSTKVDPMMYLAGNTHLASNK